MENNANISDILREMMTFLECLRNVQLPLALENLREKLLDRTKNTIRTTMMICSSPEPYLDMNSGPKTILLIKKEADTEEYIGMEESPQKQNQDYYETFEPKEVTPVATKHAESERTLGEQEYGENSQALMSIYKNLSAAQCKNNCHKCGPLHWKNGKIFSERRLYYIALIGSHLLIYRSEEHSEPCDIYSIRGYMARSTPNLLPRNGQKSKSAFEIYCPGSKTLQFIARTPKDMEQWIAKICEIGCKNEGAKINEDPKNHGSKGNASSESSVNHCKDNAMSLLHQNAYKSADNVKKKSIAKGEAKSNRNEVEKNTIESPPPLPARIPRRILPSVSPNESMPSYRSIEDYDDDDDTYHKIEDLQNGLAYQNVTLAKRQHDNVDDKEDMKVAEYDDVHASKGKKEAQAEEEKFDKISVEEEMYDDIFVLSRVKTNTEGEIPKNDDCFVAIDDEEESFYDDVEVASRVLKVNPDKIHIVETATDKVPNTSATAASAGSDLNGMAIMKACKEIMKRLQPIMDSDPDGTWENWIKTAYIQRISLSATGFYQTPDIGYSFETNMGNPFNYFTYGVACTEVEIDCLTGDHEVLRTDIVMDLGESLNPAIDIGQIEGAFIQGYGLFTLEEMIYSPTGVLISRGPGAYKLPGFTDIPKEFNVSLLKGASNPRAVYSSKAVGEPPLFLASSVFFGIKEAIKAARQDMNIHGYFRLDAPATSARIRNACVDTLTMKIKEPNLNKQWNMVP